MRIELLYFDGCPNWEATKRDVEDVLAQSGRDGHLELIRVTTSEDAEALHFVGSPSLRVNGRDVEANPPEGGYNLECRIYWVEGRPVGSPPREWIEEAIEHAAREA